MSAFISQYSITFPFSHFLYISSPLIIHFLLLYHKTHTQTHNRHTQCIHTTYHTPHTISHTPHTTRYNDTHHTPHIHSTHMHTLLPVAVIKILWKSNSRKTGSIGFTVQGYSTPWWRSWQQELEADYSVSTARKKKVMDTHRWLTFSFLCILGSHPQNGATSHGVFLPQLS